MTTTGTVATFSIGRVADLSTAARLVGLAKPVTPCGGKRSTVPQNLRNPCLRCHGDGGSGAAESDGGGQFPPPCHLGRRRDEPSEPAGDADGDTGWEIFPPRVTWGFAARVVPSIRRDRVTWGFVVGV